jgi:ankyrin repeat protein
VDILLESGADIEHRDDSGQTALFHATEAASNMLFEWALNSACWDNTSRSQLSWAASARSRDVLDFLFAHGAELDSRDYQGWTLCLGACSWERTQPSSCLNAGQTLDNEGRTPLLLE